MRVDVVATGMANLASVLAALRRAGVEPVLTTDPQQVRRSAGVVLPGVGHYAAARAELDAHDLASALTERLQSGHPTLGICLGMQLCAAGSDEGPSAPGLGAIRSHAHAFPEGVRSPHLGWTRVTAPADTRFLRDGYACFAHSFRLLHAPEPWKAATAEHGGPFVAAVEWKDVLLCQFHPELSGAWGAQLLERWLTTVTRQEVR